VACVVLPRPVDVVFRISKELHPMRYPPSNSGDSKKNWEHVSGESHSSIDEAAIKVDIRVELSTDAKTNI
jgi:hypothetical protein